MKDCGRYIDFGGQGPLMLFSHANAYPPECYSKFFHSLKSSFRIWAFRQRPLWDRSGAHRLKSWKLFRDDLLDFTSKEGIDQVTGMGHSLGGIASWMASILRPSLFTNLVLIDPVIIANDFVRGTRILPFSIKARYLPIVRTAVRRRDQWSDRKAVRAHLGAKRLFQRFDPEVFQDFLNFGIIDNENGVELAFPKSWEARIYATPPNMWPLMKKSACRITIIKAEHSDVITNDSWKRICRHTPNGYFYEMSSVGHLIPFEKPVQLAEWILNHQRA